MQNASCKAPQAVCRQFDMRGYACTTHNTGMQVNASIGSTGGRSRGPPNLLLLGFAPFPKALKTTQSMSSLEGKAFLRSTEL